MFEPIIAAAVATMGATLASIASTYFARRGTESSIKKIEVTRADLEAALQAAPHAEVPTEPPRQPTSSGRREALALVDLYMRDLLDEASRIAKRLGAEGASDVHVREAAARIGILRSRSSVIADVGLAVGSLVLGAAISYQVNIWTGGAPADGILPYAVVVAFGIGVGIFVWAATTKWRQR